MPPTLTSLRKVLNGLMGRVSVVDVSARDGLQAEPQKLPPEERARWVRALLWAGVDEVEAGSFVSPARVPQMEGAAAVLALLRDQAQRLWFLVPNRRGLDEAAKAGARNVVFVASATETHSAANLGRPVARVLADLETMAAAARAADVRTRFALSMAWVDPDEGAVSTERVLTICRRVLDLGITEITLCDTYGGASPAAVAQLLEALAEVCAVESVGLHLHDTFGTASANALVGLCLGVRRFDASIGGLGGCPFVPGAKGNMATEDLNHLLLSLGLETGIEPALLRQASDECLRRLGRPTNQERAPCPNP